MAISAGGFRKFGLRYVYIHHRPSQHHAASTPFTADHSVILNSRESACAHVHLQSCRSITSASSANPRNISCSASPRSTRHRLLELRVSARPSARPPHNPNTCSFISQYAMIGTPSQSLARHAWLLGSAGGQSSSAATTVELALPVSVPNSRAKFAFNMAGHAPAQTPAARTPRAPAGCPVWYVLTLLTCLA